MTKLKQLSLDFNQLTGILPPGKRTRFAFLYLPSYTSSGISGFFNTLYQSMCAQMILPHASMHYSVVTLFGYECGQWGHRTLCTL
jgi:hypothetical protein